MRIGAAVAAIALAAVAAALTWFGQIWAAIAGNGGSVMLDPTAVPIVLFALLVAFVIVGAIGLPIGFLVAWALRRAEAESGWSYPLAGLIAGAVVALPLGFFGEFLPAGAVAGLILGLAWWRFVRGPQLKARAHV